MIPRASGSLTAIRALFFERGWADAARRFLSSPATVRWGAVALVIGGFAGVFTSLLGGWVSVRDILTGAYTQPDDFPWTLTEGLRGSEMLLITLGLLGLYVASPKSTRWLKTLAGTGALLAVPLGIGLGAAHLRQALFTPTDYYQPWGILDVLFFGEYFVLPVGVLLLGVAALWIRGLGLWRVVPVVVGLLSSPLPYLLLFYLFYVSGGIEGEPAYEPDTRVVILQAGLEAGPAVLAGLGWVAVGLALFGARKREAALLVKERRAKEKENCVKAQRLYEGAFGAGNLSAVDEIGAPDVLDRRNGSRGLEALKRTILGLRRTFPNLRLSVEEQTAEGDTVTTRCSFSGTDRGGFLWYPPTNRHATFSVTYTDRFSDGRLAEHDGEADTEGLLTQLGLSGDG